MTHRTPTADDLGSIEQAVDPKLTPDGSAVVYLQTRAPFDEPATSEIWVRPLGGGEPRRLTEGAKDSGLAIAPDGSAVAFVRSNKRSADMYTIALDGGEPVQLTDGLRVVGDLTYAPDGTSIAFVALVDDTANKENEHAAAPPIVVSGEPQYKVDGAGWVGAARTQIFTVPAGGGEPVRLTQTGHASAPAWAPTGNRIAFAHTAVGGVPTRFQQRIGVVDVDQSDAGDSVRYLGRAEGLSGPLTWTADGAAVLAIGTETFTVEPSELYRVDAETGELTSLTPDLDRTVMGGSAGYPGGAPAYSGDGRLWFCARDAGRTVLYSRDPGGVVRQHDLGEGTQVSGLTVAGQLVVVSLADPVNPGELRLLSLGDSRGDGPGGEPVLAAEPLTANLATSLPGVAYLPTKPVTFQISDGVTVHGWLLRAPETQGAAPTLLDIHGGPHNAWSGVADTAHLYHQVLAAQGWNVLTLNPRASDGYGREFLRATMGAWGEADQADFLEPLDALVADGVADPDRLAVTGYSYGGFMTCWLTGHTDRFRAAVPGGVVVDHHTMSHSSDMGAWLRDLEIGDRAAFDRLSPLTYVDRVTTPSLVLHGQEDQRCPVGQAESWYVGLQQAAVPSRLVMYPGGSHLFILDGPSTHRRDYTERLVDWVTRWTSPIED